MHAYIEKVLGWIGEHAPTTLKNPGSSRASLFGGTH
jgi:hypothetical protein